MNNVVDSVERATLPLSSGSYMAHPQEWVPSSLAYAMWPYTLVLAGQPKGEPPTQADLVIFSFWNLEIRTKRIEPESVYNINLQHVILGTLGRLCFATWTEEGGKKVSVSAIRDRQMKKMLYSFSTDAVTK